MFTCPIPFALPRAPDKEGGSPGASRLSDRLYLLVVDESDEFHVALRWASRRAMHTGSRIGLLYVMERPEPTEWVWVQECVRADRREDAERMLQQAAAECFAFSGLFAACFVREGDKREEIISLVNEEPNIAVLVLGAGKSAYGPGPLVSTLVGKMSGKFRVPILVVPATLSDEALYALS